MMITAAIGLAFNIVMGKMLHSHGHGHNHGHDHGHSDKHGHEHKHKEIPKSKSHNTNLLQVEEEKYEISSTSNIDLEHHTIGKALKENVENVEKHMENVNIRAAAIHVIGDLI